MDLKELLKKREEASKYREEKSTIEIRKIAMTKNYRPLVVDAVKKVLDGYTTLRRSK